MLSVNQSDVAKAQVVKSSGAENEIKKVSGSGNGIV